MFKPSKYQSPVGNTDNQSRGISSSWSSSSTEPLNGLKFGRKIYFEDAGLGAPYKSGSAGSSSYGATPPKKQRGVNLAQPSQPPRCQVDLSDAKAYYSRHKVCGLHSKTLMVRPPWSLLLVLNRGFSNSVADFISFLNLTKENVVAVDAWLFKMCAAESHNLDPYCLRVLADFHRLSMSWKLSHGLHCIPKAFWEGCMGNHENI